MRGLVRISLCVAKSQGIQLRFNAACACGRTGRPPSHAFPSPGHRRLFHFSSRINDFGIIMICIPADQDKDSVIAASLWARGSCSTSTTSTAWFWREWRHAGSFLLSNCADGASTTRSVFAADQWRDRDGDGDDRGVGAATGLIHARDGFTALQTDCICFSWACIARQQTGRGGWQVGDQRRGHSTPATTAAQARNRDQQRFKRRRIPRASPHPAPRSAPAWSRACASAGRAARPGCSAASIRHRSGRKAEFVPFSGH